MTPAQTEAQAVKDQYLPAWARLRRMAAFERFVGHKAAYDDLSKLARHVRNEMTGRPR
jgi:hypothetical protein